MAVHFVDPSDYSVNSGFSYNFEYGVNIHNKLDEYVDSKEWSLLREQVLEEQDQEEFWTEHNNSVDSPDIPEVENLEKSELTDFK